MTEAGRAVQTLQATEAVRDATVSGKKVKRARRSSSIRTMGCSPRTPTPTGGARGARPAERRYSVLTIYYGDGATLADAVVDGEHAVPVAQPQRREHRDGVVRGEQPIVRIEDDSSPFLPLTGVRIPHRLRRLDQSGLPTHPTSSSGGSRWPPRRTPPSELHHGRMPLGTVRVGTT